MKKVKIYELRLLAWAGLMLVSLPQRGGYFRYKTKFLEKIPINDTFFKHLEIIDMVDEITNIKELNVDRSLDHKLNKNLDEINKIAYKVYGIKP
jgi:hypothetical protein